MQNITSIAGLKDAIQVLEAEQSIRGQLLKDQLFLTYESLKPVNLIRNTLKEISSSPYLIDNIPGTIMGLECYLSDMAMKRSHSRHYYGLGFRLYLKKGFYSSIRQYIQEASRLNPAVWGYKRCYQKL